MNKKIKKMVVAVLLCAIATTIFSENNALAAYKRNNAVQYADDWWNGNNPNYDTFSSDCTNFASQVLGV